MDSRDHHWATCRLPPSDAQVSTGSGGDVVIDATLSCTAFHVAVHRAVHQEIDTPRVFDDPLACAIVGDKDATHRSASSGQQPARVSKFIRAFVVARSRLAEDGLAAAVAAGVRQYVVLGAGLDTFAYRNLYRAIGLHVFEVDLPSTQAWKRRWLDAYTSRCPTM